MDFTENNIHNIKTACKEFVEEHYGDEEIYFDEFWKIYGHELKKWVGKPTKKWRLKMSSRKFPRVIGMTDSSQSIELVTPKILEVVATSYTYIAMIKEKLTLPKVEDVLHKCAVKLPKSEREVTVLFFAQRIFRDLKEVEGIPEKETKRKESELRLPTEEKIKIRAYSHELLGGAEIKVLFDQINSSQEENLEFKYRMFTEQDVKENIDDTIIGGKKLDNEWHSKLKNLYPALAEEFRYILDFASEMFYFDGKELWTSLDGKAEYNYYRALCVILLYPRKSQLTFEELYEKVTGEDYVKAAKNTVQHWFTVLRQQLGVKKKELNQLFKSWENHGYEVEKENEPKFLVILETSMIQKLLKYSKS